MGLRDLELKSVYDSSEYNLIKDLINPLLTNSIRYDRGVGFFSSSWLKEALPGLKIFANNDGKARLVTSPILSEKDIEAIVNGELAKQDEYLHHLLSEQVTLLEQNLSLDNRILLAWLIADGLLEFKFALPTEKLKGGDYHDKFAIFEDLNGDRVAIHGSYNDSLHGTFNAESISVFNSWSNGLNEFVEQHDIRFSKIFNNQYPFIKVFTPSEAIKSRIMQPRKSYPRPYKKPEGIPDEIMVISPTFSQPEFIELRDYQEEAISEWQKRKGRGIFEMATGTGKTITALSAAYASYKSSKRLFLVITAPFIHLVNQWEKVASEYGLGTLKCYETSSKWKTELRDKISAFNRKTLEVACIVTTNATFSAQTFKRLLNKLENKDTLLIADECHYLGTDDELAINLGMFEKTLGLSATSQRWFDEAGTRTLYDGLGEVCFRFRLKDAIGNFLTRYEYHPHLVHLTDDEEYEFAKLTRKIRKIANIDKKKLNEKALEQLLRNRSNIIQKAANKITKLKTLLQESQSKGELDYSLIYCADNEYRNALAVTKKLKIKAQKFIYQVQPNERKEILDQFEEGKLQVLVAIRCLDEGVDIPATKAAYFLASTTNPKQFVQRRGRILRKHPNKKVAIIHDLIVFPDISNKKESDEAIIRREMPRFAEFSALAINKFQAQEAVLPILKLYGLTGLLDKKPWDIYHENKQASLTEDE